MSSATSDPVHDVLNQPLPPGDVNLFTGDRALGEEMARYTGKEAIGELTAFGATAGSVAAGELARQANVYVPVLRAFDGRGERLDQVEFHPAWHELMGISARLGLHCRVWEHLVNARRRPAHAHALRAGLFYMAAQMESGHCCPITMTSAAVPVLRNQENIARAWIERICQRDYDFRFVPAGEKRAVTIGMGMTERQGGSDVRSNISQAEPMGKGGPGEVYRITGHKWFMSAPMCDAFLILAQAPGGLSCFLLPRFDPDGRVNAIHFTRLKDKLGNRSNASSEVVFENAYAVMVGEEGRGVRTIIEMVNHTRLDCAVSSAGLMRQGLALAMHHLSQRSAFQKRLIDQPLMRRVLADMALDQAAALALAMRLAHAFDRREDDVGEETYARIMTPVTKYWVCKTLPRFAYEAMECLGGNGYVEDGPMARLFRESPINAIWEGAGNIMALDLARVAVKEGDRLKAFLAEQKQQAGGDRTLAAAFDAVKSILETGRGGEGDLRIVAEGLAMAVAGVLLARHGPEDVATGFITSRFGTGQRATYGAVALAGETAILERAMPHW